LIKLSSLPKYLGTKKNHSNSGRGGNYQKNGVKNPLTTSLGWHFQLYQRFKLFPWWIRYNVGMTKEAALKEQIVKLAMSMDLERNWTKRVLRHAISEFSKKGLGSDYYGYHNIDHELEATYFTLLVAKGQLANGRNGNSIIGSLDSFHITAFICLYLMHTQQLHMYTMTIHLIQLSAL
jgi:hypothetical protein